jgi:hypothetical protein
MGRAPLAPIHFVARRGPGAVARAPPSSLTQPYPTVPYPTLQRAPPVPQHEYQKGLGGVGGTPTTVLDYIVTVLVNIAVVSCCC